MYPIRFHTLIVSAKQTYLHCEMPLIKFHLTFEVIHVNWTETNTQVTKNKRQKEIAGCQHFTFAVLISFTCTKPSVGCNSWLSEFKEALLTSVNHWGFDGPDLKCPSDKKKKENLPLLLLFVNSVLLEKQMEGFWRDFTYSQGARRREINQTPATLVVLRATLLQHQHISACSFHQGHHKTH